jgi:hypothetical protein
MPKDIRTSQTQICLLCELWTSWKILKDGGLGLEYQACTRIILSLRLSWQVKWFEPHYVSAVVGLRQGGVLAA